MKDPRFNYDHLPKGELKETSKLFNQLSIYIKKNLPEGEEKRIALERLFDSKNYAVVSFIVDEHK